MTKEGEAKKREMSQAVAMNYQAMFADLKSGKRQQWTMTNYLLLILAGLFGVKHAVATQTQLSNCEKGVATALAFIAFLMWLYLVILVQCSIVKTRKRIERFESKDNKYFDCDERKILELDSYHSPYRDWPFLLALIVVSTIGTALLVYFVWRT